MFSQYPGETFSNLCMLQSTLPNKQEMEFTCGIQGKYGLKEGNFGTLVFHKQRSSTVLDDHTRCNLVPSFITIDAKFVAEFYEEPLSIRMRVPVPIGHLLIS